MRDWNWKKILILVWAVVLMFGLVYQAEVAEAAHSGCAEVCNSECSSGCGVSMNMGCGCSWVCSDGTTGRTICT